MSLHTLVEADRGGRFDSQFVSKDAVKAQATLLSRAHSPLGDICEQILSFGAYALTNDFEYLENGVPFLRCMNFREGFVNFADSLFVDRAANSLLSKSEVKPGMVLLTMSGTVGRVVVALDSWQYPINSNQDIAKIRLKKSQNPYVVAAFLASQTGQALLQRLCVGSVQQHVFLWQLESIPIPTFRTELSKAVARSMLAAYNAESESARVMESAANTLAQTLGLQKQSASGILTYHRTLQQVSSAERFDAEYFDPAVQETMATLGRQNTKIRDVAELRCEVFTPEAGRPFHYIEISDVSQDGTARGETLDGADAPSRAKWVVRDKDVLTSTVRPVRRLSALIDAGQDGAVASSGFAVLQPRGIAPEVLLTYLRLPVICELMDLHTTASMYPAIAVKDILNLPFLRPGADVEREIVNAVTWARHSRERAAALLERAKRAVDVAIEESEEAALAFLRSFAG